MTRTLVGERKPRRLDASDTSLVTVFAALMAVTTIYAVPLPFGGLTHFGNTVMWTASILFGGLIGGLAGGIGGMIADLILDPVWAPFTFFCKLASGLACGLASREIRTVNKMTIAKIVAATLVGAVTNLLAYTPVYLVLLSPRAAILWLGRFFLPIPGLITYVATPLIVIAVMRADPRILNYRNLKKRKSSQT